MKLNKVRGPYVVTLKRTLTIEWHLQSLLLKTDTKTTCATMRLAFVLKT